MSGRTWRVGVYPGSFNPPTTAHLAVSVAARQQRRLDRVVWSVSREALGKGRSALPPLPDRMAVIEATVAPYPWLSVMITDDQLLADIAAGFDVLILGADKWHQINELQWYADEEARRAAIDRLPELAVAPRPPLDVPPDHRLELGAEHDATSSSAARAGATEQISPAARAWSLATGAWRPTGRG